MRTDQQKNADHMEAVRAVHRRSAYERVQSRIAFYQTWEREAAAGLRPLLPEDCRLHLARLCTLRSEIIEEMQRFGQCLPSNFR